LVAIPFDTLHSFGMDSFQVANVLFSTSIYFGGIVNCLGCRYRIELLLPQVHFMAPTFTSFSNWTLVFNVALWIARPS